MTPSTRSGRAWRDAWHESAGRDGVRIWHAYHAYPRATHKAISLRKLGTSTQRIHCAVHILRIVDQHLTRLGMPPSRDQVLGHTFHN